MDTIRTAFDTRVLETMGVLALECGRPFVMGYTHDNVGECTNECVMRTDTNLKDLAEMINTVIQTPDSQMGIIIQLNIPEAPLRAIEHLLGELKSGITWSRSQHFFTIGIPTELPEIPDKIQFKFKKCGDIRTV